MIGINRKSSGFEKLMKKDEKYDLKAEKAKKEVNVERYLVNQIKKHFKGECIKMGNMNGIMDRLITIYPGIAIFVEAKRKGKTMRKLQESIGNKFRRLGFEVFQIDSKAEVIELVNYIKTKYYDI